LHTFLCFGQWFFWHSELQYLTSLHDIHIFRLTPHPASLPQSAQQSILLQSRAPFDLSGYAIMVSIIICDYWKNVNALKSLLGRTLLNETSHATVGHYMSVVFTLLSAAKEKERKRVQQSGRRCLFSFASPPKRPRPNDLRSVPPHEWGTIDLV
jgi:hypothetical protein